MVVVGFSAVTVVASFFSGLSVIDTTPSFAVVPLLGLVGSTAAIVAQLHTAAGSRKQMASGLTRGVVFNIATPLSVHAHVRKPEKEFRLKCLAQLVS